MFKRMNVNSEIFLDWKLNLEIGILKNYLKEKILKINK